MTTNSVSIRNFLYACGFSAPARRDPDIHPRVVWAKFEAVAEGARLATQELWG